MVLNQELPCMLNLLQHGVQVKSTWDPRHGEVLLVAGKREKELQIQFKGLLKNFSVWKDIVFSTFILYS